jgi:hypothetical protein
MIYEFTFFMKEPLSDSDLEEIAKSCPDSSTGAVDGVWRVDFDREANSLDDAIGSAAADLRDLGCEISRVELDVNSIPASTS